MSPTELRSGSRVYREHVLKVIAATEALVEAGVLPRELPTWRLLETLAERGLIPSGLLASTMSAVSIMSATGRWQITPPPTPDSLPLDVMSSTVVVVPDPSSLNNFRGALDPMTSVNAIADHAQALPDAPFGLLVARLTGDLATRAAAAESAADRERLGAEWPTRTP